MITSQNPLSMERHAARKAELNMTEAERQAQAEESKLIVRMREILLEELGPDANKISLGPLGPGYRKVFSVNLRAAHLLDARGSRTGVLLLIDANALRPRFSGVWGESSFAYGLRAPGFHFEISAERAARILSRKI